MRRGAPQRGVAIGAQVGYRDLAGFGRRRIDIDPDDLAADVLYQLGALDACARAAGTRVRYVKPHGALYNTAADDRGQAGAIAAAVAAFDPALPLLGAARTRRWPTRRTPPACRSCPRRSPTAPTCRSAGSCPAAEPGR